MKKVLKIILGAIIGLILSYNKQLLFVYHNQNIQPLVNAIWSVTLIIISMLLFGFVENKKITKSKIAYIVILDLFLLISNTFIETGDLSYLYSNISNIFINILNFVLNYMLLKRVLIFIENFIKKHDFNIKENKIVRLFEEHPFIFSFLAILIFWLVYIIAFYPIILSPDPSFQIKQFFGVRTKYADYSILLDENVVITNHHPIMHTLLLGGCIKLGRVLINDNFGLFIYSFMQVMFLASTLSYTIKYLKENDVKTKVCLIVLGIYCLVPMFPLYAMSAVKDTIYTCFIILYVLKIDKLVKNKEKINTTDLLLILIISILTCLFRNNGIYVILLSFPFLIIYCKKYYKQLIVVFLGIICFYGTFTKVILPAFKITDGSIRETLSIPFQQTARYVKYYDKDLSKKEKKTINKVLKYRTLATRYDPMISDPVKNKFNKYATSEDLKEYFKVWFKCFFRHPVVYVEATLHNIYGYFSPQSTNWYVYYKYDTRITEDNLVDYHYNNLGGLRDVLGTFGQIYVYIPIIGLISNIGFNTWILLGLCLYSVLKKKKEYLIVLSPLLISLLICVASPVNTYFRYTMPYVFMIPCIFSLLVTRIKKTK